MPQKPIKKTPATALVSRNVALVVLLRVLHERMPLQEALNAHDFNNLSTPQRAFVRMAVTTTLRYYSVVKATLAAHLTKKMPKKTEVAEAILLLGITEALFLKTPDYAVIANTLQLLRAKRFEGLTGLANAILKKILSNKEEVNLNVNPLPDWLQTRLIDSYGADTATAIATAQYAIPPLDITCFDAPEQWAERLGGKIMGAHSIRLNDPERVEHLPGFTEGAWQVQDVAASLPAALFGKDLKGLTVLDVCAAPGGKAIQLAKQGAAVIAIEQSAERAKRMLQNIRRTGCVGQVEAVVADALFWKPKELADAILLDAPCTATGTLRRHPDVALHKRESDVGLLATLQQDLLKHVAGWLKPAGTLVYSTCSLLEEEGEDVIAAFLAQHPEMIRQPFTEAEIEALLSSSLRQGVSCLNSAGDLRLLPCYVGDVGGMDGFYAARLVKKS